MKKTPLTSVPSIARESARKDNGEFGAQIHRESEGPNTLMADPIVEHKFPVNVSEARRSLLNSRGEPGDAVRHVWMSSRLDTNTALKVVGPKDGRPLYVHVGSGFHKLEVESGNVFVESMSNWGNPVTACGDSNVFVSAGAGCKVSVSAQDEARLIVDYSSPDARGFATVSDDAQVEVYVEEGYDNLDPKDKRVGLSRHIDTSLPLNDHDEFTVKIRADLLAAGRVRLLDDGSSDDWKALAKNLNG